MSDKTKIEWTDRTWNPLRGCSRVSPGCLNCYAEKVAARFSDAGQPFHTFAERKPQPHWTGKVELIEDKLLEPLSWRKPCLCFVNSMSDLYHENVPDEWIDRIFAVMALAKDTTLQVLTKRADRMEKWFQSIPLGGKGGASDSAHYRIACAISSLGIGKTCAHTLWPLPNVWLGVSVENREQRKRIDHLRRTPAAIRFISLEPLLEDLGELDLSGIGWTIIGGESGPGARPCHIDWIRSIVRQCNAAQVPVFVKQLGSTVSADIDEFPHIDWVKGGHTFSLNSRKGGDPSEWPADIRVREFPEVK